ncbi:carboxymuconolactone decarboxylase family protein [Salinarimonas sp.]|uniref:carboxymuconolactone decarboxylase family protein n=1 Tax=Salinarimonas sp. TaxID=2766526 RepID=UPI00391AAED9
MSHDSDRPRSEAFERGLATRRAVLGDAYVDRSLATADDFSWPMQELTTEVCWDRIWNRPGLDRKSRSILNLGMIAALNRPHELEIHIRGALANGLTREEIREVLLQIAVYCGVPAGVDSFRIARKVFAEIDGAA